MKKVISILFVMAFLISGHAYAEQDEELVSVCKESAERDGISADMMNEYIDNCIKTILADEEKEKMESK
ncbi:MAG: hypothetical protein OEW99_08930 [Gammaproteobacteria bacterium]|nr:hypothetical protein [Gammaproteobacteria bacterium]MDH5659714.1 hypothetical protein [Gammaproteobacteria bacterium]